MKVSKYRMIDILRLTLQWPFMLLWIPLFQAHWQSQGEWRGIYRFRVEGQHPHRDPANRCLWRDWILWFWAAYQQGYPPFHTSTWTFMLQSTTVPLCSLTLQLSLYRFKRRELFCKGLVNNEASVKIMHFFTCWYSFLVVCPSGPEHRRRKDHSTDGRLLGSVSTKSPHLRHRRCQELQHAASSERSLQSWSDEGCREHEWVT